MSVILKRMSKTLAGKPIAENISFSFECGQTYVLYGSTGVGKTSLLNMIAGYITPDTGSVNVVEKVGYLFQDDVLFSGITALDNVLIAGQACPYDGNDLSAWAIGVLDKVGLKEKKNVPVEFL
ncbi:MAG: ATP-binding cassette domain-containing protein [Actinomycetaceae bacterium]|nr:ATP-binding cassette domain-containing protein [Actinomycetaceae bacterium]